MSRGSMSNWQSWPKRLWGDDWIAPMSEVLGINRRTIERWRAGQGEPRRELQEDLWRLAMAPEVRAVGQPEVRAIGRALRRLAAGRSFDDIRAEAKMMLVVVKHLEENAAQYPTIDVLARTKEDA